jgi:hypothetical protein
MDMDYVVRSALWLLLIALLVISGSVYADTTGTIKQMVCHDESVSPVCQVSMNGAVNLATCATSGWHYTFDGTTAEGKNMLSIILAAQLSKQLITIGGKGNCALLGSSEDLRHVYITTAP